MIWNDIMNWCRHMTVSASRLRSELAVFTFFWAWIVTLMFFLKGIDTKAADVDVFKLVDTSIALLFILSFQFSRALWRFIIIRFSMIIFIYAAIVGFVKLVYHFRNVGSNEQWWLNIDFLIIQIAALISFLLVEVITIVMVVILCIILRKVEPITDLRFEFLTTVFEILDTFFDITVLTVFVIMVACILQVSAINLIILTVADLSMVLHKIFRLFTILVISLCASVILLLRMIIQLHYFEENRIIFCETRTSTVWLNVNSWIGLRKLKPADNLLDSCHDYIIVLAIVTIYSILLGQNQRSIKQSGWNAEQMFKDRVFLDSNKNVSSYLKYLLKYGFYGYGIELTCILVALLIYYRSDVWASVYSFWLIVFVLSSDRSFKPVIWSLFKYFLIIVIPLQYAVALGSFLEECYGYNLPPNTLMARTFQWLFLPMGNWQRNPTILLWDSVVLLFTLCKAKVFEFERRYDEVEIAEMSNSSEIFLETDPMVYRKTTFGLIRYVLFWSLPNLATVWFFLAATDSMNIYAFVYKICFVLIIWNVDSYFTTTSGKARKLWKRLLLANVLIIFLKTCMQIPGCILQRNMQKQGPLWLRILFGISCLKLNEDAKYHQFLTWDILCFITMLFHDRFLRSPFYVGMAIEAELTKKFSFEAAKILKVMHDKELEATRRKHQRNLKKIRITMKRLSEDQKRVDGVKLQEPRTHQEAVTSGDYYMFRDSPSKEIELCSPENDNKYDADDEDEDYIHHDNSPNIGTLIETVIKSDMENAVKLAEGGQNPENALTSQLSTSQSTFLNETCVVRTSLPVRPSSSYENKASSASSSTSTRSYFLSEKSCLKCSRPSHDKIKIDNCKEENRSELRAANRKIFPVHEFRMESLPPEDLFVQVSVSSQPHCESDSEFTSIKPTEIMTANERVSRPVTNLSDDGGSKKYRSFYRKLITLLKFLKACINGAMISLSQFFNELARDHKYIMRELEQAKQAQRDEMLRKSATLFLVVEPKTDMSAFMRLLLSTHDLIMSRFNSVCFFFVLLVQIRNPTIYVFPLTIMVLLWGSLSVPRPSKLFWKSIFTYTVIVALFDCVIRSDLIVGEDSCLVAGNNTLKVNPFFTVEKHENFSIYYLFVLLTVLWQRSMLMNLGLWDVQELSTVEWNSNLIRKPWSSVKQFFVQLFYHSSDKIPVDVYTFIFFCDFINIFLFIFGFASMTERNEDGVTKYFFENKIPPTLLLIFCVQCMGIFLDRWIYLRRNIKAKIIFQYLQIVIVHLNLFIVLQGLTLRRMNTMIFPTLWYSMKFAYFILSAYQIRNGYPSSVYGHALCQRYTIINLYLYQAYLLFPFIYELRTVTDWLWTETTLTVSEWFGMEDIFCTVFVLKCWRDYDNKYSYRRGIEITRSVKLLEGGFMLAVFFFLLLFPLTFFAFGHVTGKQNIPEDMELSFRIGSLSPIYFGYSEQIRSFTRWQWLHFQRLYEHSPAAFTFLSEYYHDDVGVARFANFSVREWTVPPIAIERIVQQLQQDGLGGRPYELQMAAEWKLNRRTEDQKRHTLVTGRKIVTLTTAQKADLLQVFLRNSSRFIVNYLTPKFLKVGAFTTATPVEMLTLESEHGERVVISPFMTTAFEIDRNGPNVWWTATEYYDSYTREKLIDENNPNNDLIIYTFNDKIFTTGIVSFLSAQGVIGLYTTFLITFGFLIRRMVKGRVNQIFLEYIPNVDCVLQLLLDIYFARENRDGRLEEDLYAKLIFLFRSPETLIQWTRKPIRKNSSASSNTSLP